MTAPTSESPAPVEETISSGLSFVGGWKVRWRVAVELECVIVEVEG